MLSDETPSPMLMIGGGKWGLGRSSWDVNIWELAGVTYT